MDPSETCWTLIRGAAAGKMSDREAFARRYGAVVRHALEARWRVSRRLAELDDATQEVLLECLRDGGALGKADSRYAGGFRAFLYGVTRNVALRYEARAARGPAMDPDADLNLVEARDASLSDAFDREWARALLYEAATIHATRAEEEGGEAVRRVELLRLHFGEGLQIKEIAARWGVDPAALYGQHRRARAEFREALLEVVGFHQPGSRDERERECERLLALFL